MGVFVDRGSGSDRSGRLRAWGTTGGGRALRRRQLVRVGIVSLMVTGAVSAPVGAQASSTCGTSNGHTLCVSVPALPLQGEKTVTVSNTANSGVVIATWLPSGGPTAQLIEMFAPSPATNDYSFIWPTQKYLDASGTLRLQAGSTGSTAVNIAVTLGNGNATDFQHNPNDWTSYLPGPWTAPNDPVILAVGDGASNEVTSNAVAARIAAVDPPLFLNLGDIYETGTFTEWRNHYGVSEMDRPGQGTLWGATADTTQPTLGNHEKVNIPAYMDYWHGRPLYTSFTFGGVLFLDLNSSQSMVAGKPMYQYAQSLLADPNAPSCVVAFFHEPAVTSNTTIASNESDIWKLMANNGVDLVLNGHQHNMIEYKPLDANFTAGTPGAHLVELVNGAGGHGLTGVTKVPPGARIAWSKGKTAGLLALTLNGAANGNAATSIGWQWQDVSGNVLRSNSVSCGSGNRAPVVNAGPDQSIALPNQATMQGSVSDDGLPNPPGTVTTTWSQVSGPGAATITDPSSPTSTVSFPAPGTYVLRLRADDGALTSTDDVSIGVVAEGTLTLDIPITTSPDDAEESATGSVGRASTQLELVDKGTDRQTVGLRFAGVTVPPGATIERAYVQFQVAQVTTGTASLTIQGQAADDPTTFTTNAYDISSRPRTLASVSWLPAAWPTIGVAGSDQRTQDLTPVVQETVSRAGWVSGNAMVFIITGSGTRTAQSFNGTFAPTLHIEYLPA